MHSDAARAEFAIFQAIFAGTSHRTLKGLPPSIDPDRPPKFKDAMSQDNTLEWAEAFNKDSEYRGYIERNAFKVVCPDKRIRIHDTLTRLE
jgi:hypothetical protein